MPCAQVDDDVMSIILPLGSDGNSHPVDLANLIIENAADSIFVMDLEGRTVLANAAAEQTFGWTKEELFGKVLHDVVHHRYPDGRPYPMSECPLGQVIETHRVVKKHEDIFFHRNGSPVHVSCSNAPVMLKGEMVGAVLIAIDITERKRAEEHQRLLMHELNHRVKNTLATVQALVAQTLRTSSSHSEARAAIDARLTALSRAHDVLTRERWDGADLHDIVAQAVEPFALARFHVAGPEVRLAPSKALAIAMALQELATNATKYGSLSNTSGQIFLSWRIEGAPSVPCLHFSWQEKGGPPVVPPSRRGFGSRLIERSLAQELEGQVTITFEPDGVICSIEAPLR